MLLGWPDAELVGITTTADPNGVRAGYVHHLLHVAGRMSIPVASGAGVSLTGAPMGDVPDHERYWGDAAIAPAPSPAGAAIDALASSIDLGAVVVAIGPSTNLALLEAGRPGALREAPVVVMGGWVQPPAAGLPPWGPEMDWNIQSDTAAARIVFEASADLTLVTLPATLRASLRRADVARLEASGPIGRLLAHQGLAHGADHHMAQLGSSHRGLPDDLLNFHFDPVACAVALGWKQVTTTTMTLGTRLEDGLLHFDRANSGKPTQVVVDVDGPAFTDTWLGAIERADLRT